MSQSKSEMDAMFLDCDPSDLDMLGVRKHERAYNDAINICSVKPSGVEVKQVGGNHYVNKIQPWDIIDSWGLNFYEGNILKYLLRRKHNRLEDLRKLVHYAEKLIELEINGKPQ